MTAPRHRLPPPQGLADRLLGAAASAAVLAIVGVFAWLLADLLRHGLGGLSWHFLMAPVEAAGRAGGIAPILVSTLAILAICLAAALPIGLGTAILLAELGDANSRFGRFVRRCLDILAGMPSIVFGLFGNAFFSLVLGLGFSLLAGGLTLACMVLPLFIREAEEGLRAVPQEQRLAAAALGLGRWRMLWLVVLPAAAPGLFVGLVLAVGRALAETAALLFTSGYVDRMPGSLLDSGRALSIHIYDLSMNVPGGEANAYTAALVLVALLLAINSAAAWLAGRLGRARWQVA